MTKKPKANKTVARKKTKYRMVGEPSKPGKPKPFAGKPNGVYTMETSDKMLYVGVRDGVMFVPLVSLSIEEIEVLEKNITDDDIINYAPVQPSIPRIFVRLRQVLQMMHLRGFYETEDKLRTVADDLGLLP